jgi:hypothetical protein
MALQTDLSGVRGSSEAGSERPPLDHPRCLCRFDDGDVFAYAERGRDFVRASDRELWAVEREDAIVSARSGAVLAYRRGRVYFAADTDEPLYYERAV